MLRGIQAHNSEFLTYLDRIEKKVSTDNKQISTGIRVTQASDDPAAISSILKYQSSIDLLNQTQTNLATAKEVASTADGALQSASSILDELTTIATQGVTGTTSSDTRTQLSVRVQQLLQQLVAVANTSVNGRYVFGGDNSSVPPYGFDWTAPYGVVSNSSAGSTSLLHDSNGSSMNANMTAAQIFDTTTAAGTPASDNIFQTVYSLAQALSSDDAAGIQTAANSLKAGTSHLTQVSVFYGSIESWIDQASSAASDQLATLQQSLSSVKEVDMPTAITSLTSDQVALQASLSAHASLPTKTLFDYLG